MDPTTTKILTEIFDYIRCTNLADPNLGSIPVGGNNWLKSVNQFSNYQNTNLGEVLCGQVTPIRIGSTMGFGRYYTINKDASLVFICTAERWEGWGRKPEILRTPFIKKATIPLLVQIRQRIVKGSISASAAQI
jgi:hypothetical protein